MSVVSRRNLLSGAAAAAVVSALPRVAGASERPSDLAVESQEFEVPDLHPAHDGLRVVQLSDIHVGRQTGEPIVQAAIAAVNALQPDLVVLTGDYLVHSRSGVSLMRDQLGGIKAPVVAILGNHDHWVDAAGAKSVLVRHGYTVLQNQHESLTLRGERFTVVGVDDLMTRHADPKKAFAGAPRASRIALAHVPHTADQIATLGESTLCLAGHTHGGQLNLPGLTGGAMRLFLRERYQRGRYDVGHVQLYVNRGLGVVGLPVRINSAPELTVITLKTPSLPSPRDMLFGFTAGGA